ncbi:hypothetical protein GCM10027444_24860 [Actinopolyspora lacussalsi]
MQRFGHEAAGAGQQRHERGGTQPVPAGVVVGGVHEQIELVELEGDSVETLPILERMSIRSSRHGAELYLAGQAAW